MGQGEHRQVLIAGSPLEELEHRLGAGATDYRRPLSFHCYVKTRWSECWRSIAKKAGLFGG